MFARWLVASSFDAPSQAAANAAAEIALKCGDAQHAPAVVVVHIVHPTPMVITPDVMGLPDVAGELAAAREDALVLLEREAARVKSAYPGVAVSTLSLTGPVGPALLGAADDLNVDAIAIGSGGKGGVARVVFGSASDETVHHSQKPVMVVKVTEARGSAATP